MDYRKWVSNSVDTWFDIFPQTLPNPDTVSSCKIIAHRGIFDNIRMLENTLPAFQTALDAGVWGIELDVQCTHDGIPVVCHDPDLTRLFSIKEAVFDCNYSRLKQMCPQIPSLEQVLEKFAGRLHLMLEIKSDNLLPEKSGHEEFIRLLGKLRPVKEYHLLSLDFKRLDLMNTIENRAKIAVFETNLSKAVRLAQELQWGGVAGWYPLLTKNRVRHYKRTGLKTGTGFPGSEKALFRELNKEVDWVFTNHAAQLCKYVRRFYTG